MSAPAVVPIRAVSEEPGLSTAAGRFLPSVRDLVLLLPVLFLFVRMGGIGTLLGDGDTGWHLRTGEWIAAHRAVPYTDIFSFTKAGQPWFAWEWLWDLGFGWLHARFGMQAVLLLNVALISVCLYLVYRECWRASGHFLAAFAATFVAAAGTTIHWLARPHLVSLLLIVMTMLVLDRARNGDLKQLWWLPVMTIPWANLHAGFFMGWTFIGAYALGEALAAWQRGESPWRGARPYLAALAGCVGVSLINPYGWRLHAHILSSLWNGYIRENIVEFLSVNFHSPVGIYVAVFVLCGGAATVLLIEHRRYGDAIILNAWTWLGLYSARNLPIYFLVTAPMLAWALAEALDRGRRHAALDRFDQARREFESVERMARLVWVAPLAFVLLGVLLYAPNPPKSLQARYDSDRYPEAALPAIRALGPSVRLFTDDEWGDFLSFRLYPNLRVFADGRSDFLGGKILDDMAHALQARYDWREILSAYGINTVLLHAETPLASTLKLCPDWCLVRDDGISILFVALYEGAPRGRAAVGTIHQPETKTEREKS
jgi:hypothetical protein